MGDPAEPVESETRAHQLLTKFSFVPKERVFLNRNPPGGQNFEGLGRLPLGPNGKSKNMQLPISS